MIYLTTDGYIDQANPQRRRFGSPSFIALIEQVQKEPMQTQKQILTETLEIFMEGTKQRDDITVLAIKL
jgi:serine phosphatase RsbU (regulator of sigma subunit)